MKKIQIGIFAGCLVIAGTAQAGESRQTSRATAVTFRLVTTTATEGFDPMSYDGNQLYVSSDPSFSSGDIRSVETADAGTSLRVMLTHKAAENLASLASRNQADRMAVLVGSRVVAAPTLDIADADGSTLLSGISSSLADRLVALLSREGVAYGGPVISATSPKTAIRAGDTFTVDTHVTGVDDLGAYEVKLVVTGGASGEIFVEDVEIAATRTDFVFDATALTVTDNKQFRAVGAMMQGGVNAEESSYLATYTLRASEDASGTFYINALTGVGSHLRDSEALVIPYRLGKDLAITVGKTKTRERFVR